MTRPERCALLQHLSQSVAILPASPAQEGLAEEEVLLLIRSRQTKLRRLLDALSDNVEIVATIEHGFDILETDGLSEASTKTRPYLRSRLVKHRRFAEEAMAVEKTAKRLVATLTAPIRAAAVIPFVNQSSCHYGADVSLMVSRSTYRESIQAVRACASKMKASVTGPWPPLTFAGIAAP
ncbi:MAG: GvpL/GvpF family gas vesicle protein [Pseudomonadota bacterium]